MANKTLADFLPDIAPQVKGCPDPVIENAVRNALIDFCEQTRVYQDWCTYTAGTNDEELELDPPKDTVVVDVLEVDYDGDRIDPVIPHDLDRDKPGWKSETGEPTGFYMKQPGRLMRLVPIPEAAVADAIHIWAALKPSKTATAIVDWMFEEYFEDIKHGALARLYGMPNEPWSSATRSKDEQDVFDVAIATRKDQAARNFTRAPLRTRPIYSLA